jgi:5,10-methylene-tetrahydrofolate dehydrogenase/methenyl tetrahydrofolate cyclohydrolase
MKHPRVKLKGKRQKESGERAHLPPKTTLADLLAAIDTAADDKEISGIIDGLSLGKRAMLYSALQYTEPHLPTPGTEQPKGNRLRALYILRELLL